jgi:hypothetical protein
MPAVLYPVTITPAAVPQQGQRLLHGEDHVLDVGVERIVVLLFRNGAERQESAAAGVSENGIELAHLLVDLGLQTVLVGCIGSVGPDSRHISADRSHRLVQFALTPSCDVDICALLHKELRRGETDSAAAAGYGSIFPSSLPAM